MTLRILAHRAGISLASGAAIRAFREMGFDSSTSMKRYLAFSAYIQGMAMLLSAEHQESERSGTSYPSWWRAQYRQLDRIGATIRHTWLVDQEILEGAEAFNADETFHEGLQRIISALTADSLHPSE